MTNAKSTVTLPDGETIPKLGQGTWEMGERPNAREAEIAALREGVDLGMTLIDTAEMYGDGESEKLIAEALGDRRDELFIVSKVYPHNGSERGVVAACERSLRRLQTDRIDLYLLHWRGGEDLPGVVAGFEKLRRDGKIRHWGVSNFDVDDLEELFALDGGDACATDQILYNVARRGPEFDLLPWMREWRMPAMAYSPVDHARLPRGGVLEAIALARGVSFFQVALAWVLQQDAVFAIPKASDVRHVRENFAALSLALSADELAQVDREFRGPTRKRGLEML
ncbi:Oxidoreductase, aldo/keto reductase family [Candidatus Burkholderia verschuerenii]|uniref:Oxidoreductase, aldo/keto reductase family n=1 Tax=Candidatus Burkholderia verschuerenii TaxID=242163 RepID=A0A0L0M8E0_9BURK|nr:aldo/keto reductase [Candidatus Burkholderia verschuerenii]KND58613.1 Oxidoreductase, aldo/keto reductase family [Candidatus Burkholderia verschuerenii]